MCTVNGHSPHSVLYQMSPNPAESVYEAAARGVAEFKRTGFALAEIGPATRLTITERLFLRASERMKLRLPFCLSP
jgi:hypothetical protein